MELSQSGVAKAAIVLGGALLVGSVALGLIPAVLDGPGCSAEFVMFAPVDVDDLTARDQITALPFGVACVLEINAVEVGRVDPSPAWTIGILTGGVLAAVGVSKLRRAGQAS